MGIGGISGALQHSPSLLNCASRLPAPHLVVTGNVLYREPPHGFVWAPVRCGLVSDIPPMRTHVSRRLKAAASSRLSDYDRGRVDAALDVAALAGTFDTGFVWASEAVDAALGVFDPRTVSAGLADWALGLADDVQEMWLDRLGSPTDVSEEAARFAPFAEGLASNLGLSRPAAIDALEHSTVVDDAYESPAEGLECRTCHHTDAHAGGGLGICLHDQCPCDGPR